MDYETNQRKTRSGLLRKTGLVLALTGVMATSGCGPLYLFSSAACDKPWYEPKKILKGEATTGEYFIFAGDIVLDAALIGGGAAAFGGGGGGGGGGRSNNVTPTNPGQGTRPSGP